ncbi:MAG: hypothetical protein ABEH56_00545 [Salinirussus sp.]
MGNPHRADAVTALVDRDWGAAADAFTLAAHHDLGGEVRTDADETGGNWTVLDPGRRDRPAFGLSLLCRAALCYRLAGADDRARLRALTVIPLAIDGRDHVRTGVGRGVSQEFAADARAVRGDTDGAESAYGRAAALYRDHAPADPLDAVAAPTFEAANRLLLHASRNTGLDVEWDDLHGDDPSEAEYLAHRAAYKRRTLPRVVDRVLDAGLLHVPRGTTEYNNDTYRCPDCGDDDVNWVAGETVCLHCSVRVVEQ